jgi:hypothetical protein
MLPGERTVTIAIPPLWGSGTTFVVPVTELRDHNHNVRVRVRVEPDR